MTDKLHLQDFKLDDLAQFTHEGCFPINASPDHRLFYVGRDDVHGVLVYLHSRITQSYYGNMFGYDDEELNDLLMAKAADPMVAFFMTLDKTQAGSVHEKKILAHDVVADPVTFNAHFATVQSATHQISHTKGGVLDGLVGFEGSTNWSSSGEGTFVSGRTAPGGPGYKAQNNTVMVFTDPATITAFQAELVLEHMAAVKNGGALTRAK